MPYVTLSDNPSRDELRDAVAMLKLLELCGDASAKAERIAAERVMRAKYPRRPKGEKAEPKPKRRRANRRILIDPMDAVMPCPACSTAMFHVKHCSRCAGSGTVPGIAEYDPAQTHEAGVLARGERPLRGDFARQFGCSDYVPASPKAHKRGFVAGRMLHRYSAAAKDAAASWPRWVSTIWTNNAGEQVVVDSRYAAGPDDADISAELEAKAIRRMRGVVAGDPRGKRLSHSRRDKSLLTPNQTRRATMDRRVRRYQSEHNTEQRREAGWTRRMPSDAMAEALLLCGIDPAEFAKHCKAMDPAEREPKTIHEARRRGDIPYADGLPDWHRENHVTLDDGRVVVVEGRMLAATHIRRLAGGFETISGAVKVREENGNLDLLHPDDVPEGVIS